MFRSYDGEYPRVYYMYTPTTVVRDAPLVICAHGGGVGAREFFEERARLYQLSEQYGFLVACPEAMLVDDDGHWVYRWFVGNEVEFIDNMFDDIAAKPEYSVDWDRVYAMGNSAGGYLAQVIAYELSGRIAAICISSCGAPSRIPAQRPPKRPFGVMQSHNINDPIIDYSYAVHADRLWSFAFECARAKLDSAFVDTPRVEKKVNRNRRDGVDVVLFTLHLDGQPSENHGWPHREPQGLELNRQMWDFFQRYTRKSALKPNEDELASRSEVTTTISLAPARPNPFNATTTVALELPQPSHVKLAVYDVTGRRVATLSNQWYAAGDHALTFDATALASGVYFIRADPARGKPAMRKITLIR